MKKLVLICVISLGVPLLSSAQEDTLPRTKIYRTWVNRYSVESKMKGVLYQITDSSVLVANSPNKLLPGRMDLSTGNFTIEKVYYNDIDLVKARRINQAPIGTLAFALVGASLGAIVGASYDPGFFTKKEQTEIGAIIGGVIGTAAGAAIWSFEIYIPINGNYGTFNQNRSKLKKYSYMH